MVLGILLAPLYTDHLMILQGWKSGLVAALAYPSTTNNLFDNEFYYARNDLNSVQPAPARTIIGSISVKF